MNNDDSNQNLMKSNKPIRILKRPTSQSQLIVTNDINNSNQTTLNNTNSTIINDNLSSTISIIPRNSLNNSIHSSQISNSQSIKPTIKTYEQREQEYRLARLR